MSHLSDKDIDRLSREAAEYYEPDDSLLSWNKLEQQLTRQLPEHPPEPGAFFRMRPLIWGPAVLLVTGITYFTIKNIKHRSSSTLKAPVENASHTTEAAMLQNASASATTAISRADSIHALKSISDPLVGKSAASPESNKAGYTGISGSSGSPGRSGHSSNAAFGNGTTALGAAGYPRLNNGPDKASASASNHSNIASTNASDNLRPDARVQLPMPVTLSGRPAVRGNDASLNRFPQHEPSSPKPSKSLQVNRSLVVGVVMGPDYTQAGSTNNNQLSNNIGISVGYYLTRRLSINTGFQYTTKYYWADSKPFQPGGPPPFGVGPFGSFPHIESVNGSSSLFEIPLTLRYDLVQQGKTKVFVNAGLSSYLLRREDYIYYFHNAGRAYEWENTSNEHCNYWLSVGDLSAGLEQSLGKGFSFQAEPFVRIPFRGMGIAGIKMNSFGFLFSFRYAPVLNRTRK